MATEGGGLQGVRYTSVSHSFCKAQTSLCLLHPHPQTSIFNIRQPLPHRSLLDYKTKLIHEHYLRAVFTMVRQFCHLRCGFSARLLPPPCVLPAGDSWRFSFEVYIDAVKQEIIPRKKHKKTSTTSSSPVRPLERGSAFLISCYLCL